MDFYPIVDIIVRPISVAIPSSSTSSSFSSLLSSLRSQPTNAEEVHEEEVSYAPIGGEASETLILLEKERAPSPDSSPPPCLSGGECFISEQA